MSKSNPDKGGDEALDALLQEWTLDAFPRPGFESAVWRRIERGRKLRPRGLGVWGRWMDTLLAGLSRPSMAAASIVLFLTLGAAGGWARARQERERITETVSARYVQTVDPYRMSPQR